MESVSVIKEVPKEVPPDVPQSNSSLFKRNPELFKHITVVCDNPIRYKCTVCNKSFKSKANCSYHKNCPNDSMKQYECEICKRRFSVKSHYKYHLLTHNGSNPFSCSICGKSFKAKNKLRRHEEVHAEKRKSYPCSKCEKTFLGKTSLKNHLRSHTGEKLFHCSHCSKAFSEKKNLIHHLNSVKKIKNWVCEVCGSSFVVKWNLELHRRTHTATRSIKCPDCPKKFLQKRYLIRHMELHNKDSKYECKTCNLEFSRKDNLRRHNLRHLEESDSKDTKQCEKLAEPNIGDEVAAKSVEIGKPNVPEAREDRTRRKSEEVALSEKANASEHCNAVAGLRRESVIKSVARSTICNQISVIKDGRAEFAKVCSAEVDVRIRSTPQLVPPQNYPVRSTSVIESLAVRKQCSNDQSQRNPSRLSDFVQNNRERMPMTRHCPIPKKKMVASYMNELYADSLAANSNAGTEGHSTVNFVQSNSSRCLKYCDNNLLDLSMKSQGESCY